MRSLLVILSICMTCIMLQSCMPRTTVMPIAHGNPGDIIVVMNDENWQAEAGDSLRAMFSEFCPNLPFEQPIMDLHQISYAKFVEINQLHRNVIFFERVASQKKGVLNVENNKYAKNQVFVRITAANQTDFVKALCEQRDSIVKLFLSADRDRYINSYCKARNSMAEQQLADTFGINISLPEEYRIDEFLDKFSWISFETKKTTNGIFVYEYPLTDTTDLSVEQIIAMRNIVLQKNVPGGREGSYMTTEIKFDYPSIETIMHNGTKTAVVHGMWKMHGDFMGGPFVSYTKIDEAHQRVVCVEGFVYEPNAPVREKIRNIESIIYTYSLR